MDHPVIKKLSTVGTFSSEDLQLLAGKMTFRELKKGEIWLEKGQVCSSIGLIQKGAMYQYLMDDQGDLKVRDLRIENDWILQHQSFISRSPSDSVIEAFEDTTLYELHIDSLHALISQSPVFFQLGTILDSGKSESDKLNSMTSPQAKYLHLIDARPELISSFPLKLIASYMRISPETLSRVRKKITEL
ncbi:Crp/Fnr family transcriptional regulator [Roseivirga sp.]|uniref:Crp/Fnr family transcriptional regulator n=1 Tax=Roseivirga sp. TaxID=1964215 RepID=UPI003B5180C1